jgi:carbon storage regulator CsrA
MLVLSRRVGERIFIGHDIVITVTEIRGDRIKLGFECPDEVPIYREEVYRRMCKKGWAKETAAPPAWVDDHANESGAYVECG